MDKLILMALPDVFALRRRVREDRRFQTPFDNILLETDLEAMSRPVEGLSPKINFELRDEDTSGRNRRILQEKSTQTE